jgi:hypothetical protein
VPLSPSKQPFFTFFNILNPLNQTVGGHVELVETLAMALRFFSFPHFSIRYAALHTCLPTGRLEMTTHCTIPNPPIP